jgi:hypothetical protein
VPTPWKQMPTITSGAAPLLSITPLYPMCT